MLQKRPPEPLEGEIISPVERAWLDIRAWLTFKRNTEDSRERSERALGSRILQAVIAIVMLGGPLAMIVIALARLAF